MRTPSLVFTFSLLYGVRFVSGRWESGIDGDLYGEIPEPTPELLYRDGSKHGAVLMETNLGSPRNRTTRRDLKLGARQVYDPPEHMDRSDTAINRLPAIQASFSRAQKQILIPAAPWTILYVDSLHDQDRCSMRFRSAAARRVQKCVVVPANSVSVLTHAVLTVKLAAQLPRVRNLI